VIKSYLKLPETNANLNFKASYCLEASAYIVKVLQVCPSIVPSFPCMNESLKASLSRTLRQDITMLKRSHYAGCNLILTSIIARWTQSKPIILLNSCIKTLAAMMDAHDA